MASVTLHSLYSRVSGDPSGGYSSVVLQSPDLQGERGRERCPCLLSECQSPLCAGATSRLLWEVWETAEALWRYGQG